MDHEQSTFDIARQLTAAGISVLPIATDGMKGPALASWKPLQKTIATVEELQRLFVGDVGIGIIGGAVSGGLEIIDLDQPGLFDEFSQQVEAIEPGLIAKLTHHRTPRPGDHLIYRCHTVEGNQKLAQLPESDADSGKVKPVTIIETRGEGGYVLAPGSPARCHPTRRLYEHVGGLPITEVVTITPEQRSLLLSVARSFNLWVEQLAEQRPQGSSGGQTPGDDYATRVSWLDILEPHGWRIVGCRDDVTLWCRPRKSRGISATTGIKSTNGNDLFCVFSTNAHPFDVPGGRQCGTYSKFAAYTLLNHGGDYSAAASALAREGYGEQANLSPVDISAVVERKQPIELANFKPFPVVSLPEPICSYVAETSKSIGCDSAMIALPMLASLAAAIGNTRRIHMYDDWYEPSVLWTAIVCDSGQRKSPAIKSATKFLRAEEALTECRFIISDVTKEALQGLLATYPRGFLLEQDELAAWFNFGEYKKSSGSDVAFWLSRHTADSLTVDRKAKNPETGKQDTLYVPVASCSITGGIQPGTLGRMLTSEFFDNGLAARFLLAYPPRLPRTWNKNASTADTKEKVSAIFSALVQLPFAGNIGGSVDLPLTESGESRFIEYFDRHAGETLGLSGRASALWSKLEGGAARLALIVHCVRLCAGDSTLETPDAVDERSIAAGVAMAEWFGEEGLRIYDRLKDTESDRDTVALVDWIKGRGGSVTVRDVQRGVRRLKPNDSAELALVSLAKAGFGTWQTMPPGEKGGPATRRFVLALSQSV